MKGRKKNGKRWWHAETHDGGLLEDSDDFWLL